MFYHPQWLAGIITIQHTGTANCALAARCDLSFYWGHANRICKPLQGQHKNVTTSLVGWVRIKMSLFLWREVEIHKFDGRAEALTNSVVEEKFAVKGNEMVGWSQLLLLKGWRWRYEMYPGRFLGHLEETESVTEGVYLIFCKTSRKKVLYLNCYSQFA